jgi:hypothetical protein
MRPQKNSIFYATRSIDDERVHRKLSSIPKCAVSRGRPTAKFEVPRNAPAFRDEVVMRHKPCAQSLAGNRSLSLCAAASADNLASTVRTSMFNYWANVAMLAAESQHTIWLRMMKMASGGVGARNEAQLMVSEKIEAAAEATGTLARGGTANSIVQSYRRKVRANSRRLSR